MRHRAYGDIGFCAWHCASLPLVMRNGRVEPKADPNMLASRYVCDWHHRGRRLCDCFADLLMFMRCYGWLLLRSTEALATHPTTIGADTMVAPADQILTFDGPAQRQVNSKKFLRCKSFSGTSGTTFVLPYLFFEDGFTQVFLGV